MSRPLAFRHQHSGLYHWERCSQKVGTPHIHSYILSIWCLFVGWLREQLAIQASGLSGNLQFFWPDVMNSSWMGGHADTGLHERTPYWLNGFVPLAYQLQEPPLIQTVCPPMSGIIILSHSLYLLHVDRQSTTSTTYWGSRQKMDGWVLMT